MTEHEQTNKIIERLYNDKNINNAIVKYFPKNTNLRDEFKSHLFFEVLRIDKQKLIELDNCNKIVFFVIAIIKLQVKSSSSSWFRYLKQQKNHQESDNNLPVLTVENEYEDKINEVHNNYINVNMADKIYSVIDKIIKENPELTIHIRMFIARHFYGLSLRKTAKDFNIKFTTGYNMIKHIEAIIAKELGLKEIKKYKEIKINKKKRKAIY